MRRRDPLVIVGSGVAGMATALSAAPAPVVLVCRASADGAGTATCLAQGGIAAALAPGDSAAAHARDTMIAGAQHNDARRVRRICARAPDAIAWLSAHGVVFDRDAGGNLRLGREGGHSAARIVHAGGDATGAAIVHALRQRVAAAGHVQCLWQRDVDALLLRGGAVCGVRARDRNGAGEEIPARAVVLATGGVGALFERTSNPGGTEGSGLALGIAAGAALRDAQFVQFHPTALAVPHRHRLPLITEALRGAGARLHDAQGRSVTEGMHALGDLAPRDVVARAVCRAQREGGRVWLDATRLTCDWERDFPTVLAACRGFGVDPSCEPIPITPAAHFHMGGLDVDDDGATGVPGLHAVGEVACNGLHGANRLASNSLLEGVVCGRRLGALLGVAAAAALPADARSHWAERGADLDESASALLRRLAWTALGPVREARAPGQVCHLVAELAASGWQARVVHAMLAAESSSCRRREGLPDRPSHF